MKSLRISLEEERRVTRDQLEAERGLLQRSKDEFLAQQRQMLADINEERKTLALERAEVSAAQRGIVKKEKQKHDNIIKVRNGFFNSKYNSYFTPQSKSLNGPLH